jgi:hypothetical protein
MLEGQRGQFGQLAALLGIDELGIEALDIESSERCRKDGLEVVERLRAPD